jgi:hypothetical protein
MAASKRRKPHQSFKPKVVVRLDKAQRREVANQRGARSMAKKMVSAS